LDSLTGKLLVAMPTMPDPRFAHAVVYLCAHSGDGAMGLILNKTLPDLTLGQLADHLDQAPGGGLSGSDTAAARPIHFGGPVETGRGFVLHSPDYATPSGSAAVAPGITLTTSAEILGDLLRGQGPSQAIIALGYAGWAPKQLEGEITSGGWLLAEGMPELVFHHDHGGKWLAALDALGVDPRMLSGATGRA
jgi:putative transcriptional regulator